MMQIKRATSAAHGWWLQLTPAPERGHSGDRGALARLRRCATVAEAMYLPETMALFRRCGADDAADLPAVALTAAVLAHVRQDCSGRVARQLGPDDPDKPETAILKPIRFRRLLETRDADDTLTAFRRLVALAGGSVGVEDLAHALLTWLRPVLAEETRRRWVFAYWNADPAPAERGGVTPPPEVTVP